jgi:hypothetical protein
MKAKIKRTTQNSQTKIVEHSKAERPTTSPSESFYSVVARWYRPNVLISPLENNINYLNKFLSL